MSADNYYVVRRHPKGGFTYVMGFASDDQPDLTVSEKHPRFPDLWEAYAAASSEYAEYGVQIHEECQTVETPAHQVLSKETEFINRKEDTPPENWDE